MKKRLVLIAAILSVASSGLQAQKNADADKQAAEMVSKMTLAEKIGQMGQISIDIVTKGQDTPPTSNIEIDMGKLREALLEYHVGSILNAPNTRTRTPEWWTNAVA